MELVTIIDELTFQDAYAMYPSEERPEYWALVSGSRCLARPEETRCACGNSLRYECATDRKPFQIVVRHGTPVHRRNGCECTPFELIYNLEDEQNGFGFEYGEASNRSDWWKGYLKSSRGANHDFRCTWHQRTLHLADRVSRWSPSILRGSSSRRVMALYRRVRPSDLMKAWHILHANDVVLPPGQLTLERWLVPVVRLVRVHLCFAE